MNNNEFTLMPDELAFSLLQDPQLDEIYKKLTPEEQGYLSGMIERDGHTGLYNKRKFERDLRREIMIAERQKRDDLALLMIDIDYFKKYNDSKGHVAGDVLLKEVADNLQIIAKGIVSGIRPDDMAYRYGGEEFSVIIPYMSLSGREIIGERLRRQIEENTDVTISIGGARYERRGSIKPENLDTVVLGFIERADRNLYQAKDRRNVVVF